MKTQGRYIRSKKGSYIMEAAVVLPFVILAVITSVLIVMFFYMSVTEQCKLHMALRCEAGAETGRTIYTGENEVYADENSEMSVDKGITGTVARGSTRVMMNDSLLLRNKAIFAVEGEWHGTDGAGYVRRMELIEGIADEQ